MYVVTPVLEDDMSVVILSERFEPHNLSRGLTHVRGGIHVQTDHADTKSGLVVVHGLPLRRVEGAQEASGVLVRDLAQHEDTTIVTLGGGGVEDRQGGTRLRHNNGLVWDAVALQPQGGNVGRGRVSGEDQDGISDRVRRGGHTRV